MAQTQADADWVRAVVDRYERPLVLYAVRLTGNLERARDVVQDAFVKLCTQDRAKIEPYVTEWLYTVCRNRALDVQRKESRSLSLTDDRAGRELDREPDPAAAVEEAETNRLVLAAIEELSDKQQEAVRLKFQHGMSYRQIAKVMELTTSYVGYLIHAGIKSIRRRLGDATDDDLSGPVARIAGPRRAGSAGQSDTESVEESLHENEKIGNAT